MDSSSNSNLAIIIPTKNRAFWVDKVLKYYSDLNFSGSLIIVDSSEEKISEEVDYFNLYKSLDFNIIYNSSLSIHEAIAVGVKSLPPRIKYVIQTGDDDFICTANLSKFIDFLEINSDFSTVYGEAFAIGLRKSARDKIVTSWCSRYWNGFTIESNNPLSRVNELLKSYLNLEFAIRRKEGVLAGIELINGFIGTKDFAESTTLEILAGIDTAISGKVCYLRGSYLIRGDHADRPNRFSKSIIRQYVGTSKFGEIKSYSLKRLAMTGVDHSKNLDDDVNEILLTYIERSIIKRIKNANNGISVQKILGYFWRRTKGFYFKIKLRKYLQLLTR